MRHSVLDSRSLLFSYFTYSTVYMQKAMAPHSSTLAWKNPMDRGAWWGCKELDTTVHTRIKGKKPDAKIYLLYV